ncbi:uncharacterized protein DEA37_0014418 [Paragonimus westermani]|uniref:Uncharacterized protein n=1 Tax=Paragonimus westermani TaxID=34504 RepID=A0A5J4NLF0_9TREM|nr:uncharacterized protein DEA37_0014418 [Paragonimus westermani]
MESCQIALTGMKYVAGRNSLSTLEKISRNLPRPLLYQRAEFVDKITLGDGESDFLNVLEFISSRDRVARCRLGQLANRNERSVRGEERHSHRNAPERKFAPRNSIYTSQSNDASLKTLTCQLRKGNHRLSNCSELTALCVPKRLTVVKAGRVCFMCLGSGHRVYGCRMHRKCGVENCGAGHHRLLHGVRHLPTESTEGDVRANCGSISIAQHGVVLEIPVSMSARQSTF